LECWSEARLDASLFADFVGGNPIKVFMAFNGNYFATVEDHRVQILNLDYCRSALYLAFYLVW
jgi:hypothetical protein